MRDALCLISVVPNYELLQFYNKFIYYDVYIIVDNNYFDLSEYKEKFPKLNFVQINNEECIQNGFYNTHTCTFWKNVIGWDKVIYKMCQERKKYNYIWIVEDDVFIPREKTLRLIDAKEEYKDIDLIANSPFTEGNYDIWLWHLFIDTVKLEKPFYNGMMCAIRVTNPLLEKIEEYVSINKTLFFLEALFPTIAKHHGLKCQDINEIKTITFRDEFEDDEIKSTNLYHPFKEIERHRKVRELLYISSFD